MNILLFLSLYVILFCILPMFVYLMSNKNNIFLINLLFTLYLITISFLVLFSVTITKTHISISFPTNEKFFTFYYSSGLNTYNILINFALFFPLGIICYLKSKMTNNKHLYSNPIFIGLIISIIIECLQVILPTSRYFDFSDILFDSITTFVSYSVCFILLKAIKKHPFRVL